MAPIFRLTFRATDGRQQSIYLGSDPLFAAEIKELLVTLQSPRRQVRSLSQARDIFRTLLRSSLPELDRQLAAAGLHRKGREVRGWRQFDAAVLDTKPKSPACQFAPAEQIRKTAVSVDQQPSNPRQQADSQD